MHNEPFKGSCCCAGKELDRGLEESHGEVGSRLERRVDFNSEGELGLQSLYPAKRLEIVAEEFSLQVVIFLLLLLLLGLCCDAGTLL